MSKIIGNLTLVLLLLLLSVMVFSAEVETMTPVENINYLSDNGYADIVNSSFVVTIDPAIVATFVQVLRWYNSSIKIIKSLLKSSGGKIQALLSSNKNKATSNVATEQAIYKNKVKSNIDNYIGTVSHLGRDFVIGNIASSGCLRESHEWAVVELAKKKEPFVKSILGDLSDSILSNDGEKNFSNLKQGLNGDSSLLLLEKKHTIEDRSRLFASIKHYTNTDSKKLNPVNSMSTSNGQYYSQVLRYKLMVMEVQKVVTKLYSKNLTLDSGVSQEGHDKRLYASSVSNDRNLSLQVKNKSSNYKEISETLSNIYISEEPYIKDLLPLLSIIASSSIDKEK